jgi:hypothetical protein
MRKLVTIAALVVVVGAVGLLLASCAREAEGDAKQDITLDYGVECKSTGACAGGHADAGGQDHTGMAAHESGESRDAGVWVCKCCPDVRASEPGVCPECNMELVPQAVSQVEARSPTAAGEWTCGMHPAIRSKEPGKCPICNMDLVPVKHGEEGALRIDPGALERVGAKHHEVGYLPLSRTIWTVGRVEYDERLVRQVASRIAGRVDRLYADFVGVEVARGQPLLAIYSPELVTALAEYRTSLEAAGHASQSDASLAADLGALARSARVRLSLWGLDERDIEAMQGADDDMPYLIPIRSPMSGTVVEKNVLEGEYVREGEGLYVVADLSRVWITADVYEDDIGSVKVGDRVSARSKALPGEVFKGEVTFIDPLVDRARRSVRVRMEIDNPRRQLKPGMYVETEIELASNRRETAIWVCPMHPEVVSQSPGECPECCMFLEEIMAGEELAVPKDAVVHAGGTPLVYVERDRGVYEPREVVLGRPSTASGHSETVYYPVLGGLARGERVVTGASFLVHSQSKLTGTAASAYGGALDVEGPGGHTGHGR